MVLSKISPILFLALASTIRSQVVDPTPFVDDNPLFDDDFIANNDVGGRMDTDESWGYLYLAAMGISIISWIFTFIVLGAIHKGRWQEYRLKRFVLTLFAFGIGAILGTTAVILLPKAFGQQVTKYSINGREFYNSLLISTEINSLLLLAGFTWFFVWDLFIRHWLAKPHEKGARTSPHDSLRVEEPPKHNVIPTVVPNSNMTGQGMNPTGAYNMVPHNDIIGNTNVVGQPQSYPQQAYNNPNFAEHRGSTEISPTQRTKALSLQGSRKQTVLIILRQMWYNFFAGMAIGTAFGTGSNRIALSISIAILIQEIPFELADTILLYYSGLSFKNSFLWNLVFNTIPVLIGCSAARGLATTSLRGISYLFASVVGAFLYVAASNIMAAIVKERKGGMKMNYVIAAILGMGVQFAIFQIEE